MRENFLGSTTNQTTYAQQNDQNGKNSFYNQNRGNVSGQWLPLNSVWQGTIFVVPLTSDISTDLPGECTAVVTKNVYSSQDGRYLLIPQNSKLLGSYNSSISYSQSRVQVGWHTARKFETVAKEYLRRLNKVKLLKPSFNTIGRYVYNDKNAKRNNEFDVVTKDDCGMAYYECKYEKSKVSAKEIQAEIASTKEIGLNFYKYGFFSKSGFEADVEAGKYTLYSLDDLYDLKNAIASKN